VKFGKTPSCRQAASLSGSCSKGPAGLPGPD
jgi:hypothetical protein